MITVHQQQEESKEDDGTHQMENKKIKIRNPRGVTVKSRYGVLNNFRLKKKSFE